MNIHVRPAEVGVGDLFDWMRERHSIFLRREVVRGGREPSGEAEVAAWEGGGWRADYLTHDPVLRAHRFCNVFRELDKTTVWVREHIREPFAEHEDLWLMLAIARTINEPDTLAELIGTPAWPDHPDFHPDHLTEALEARMARGEKVYTSAYMIRAENDPNKPWYQWSKQRYVAQIVIGRLWESRRRWRRFLDTPGLTLHQVHAQLSSGRHYGWGGDGFMAYEVVTDLRHTRYLRDAPDVMTWANAGPGARRGLNRIAGRPLRARMTPERANREMRDLLRVAPLYLPGWFPSLEMRDIEHSLCETDKWLRVRLGEGRPRELFRP